MLVELDLVEQILDGVFTEFSFGVSWSPWHGVSRTFILFDLDLTLAHISSKGEGVCDSGFPSQLQ